MSPSPTSRSRRPAGTPTGGQFAPETHAEPEVGLDAATTPPTQPSESRREVDADGTVRWYDADGQLHRDGGPAVEEADGTKEWYQHGELHRDDGPAVEWPDATREWYQHGQRHRDDGPAMEFADGATFWYQHGQRHRDGGPAIESPDGGEVYFVHGVEWAEPEFWAAVSARAERLKQQPRISFSATALREHFEGDLEIEPLLDGLSDEQIEAAAHDFLASPDAADLWDAFHLAGCDIVRDAASRR